MSVDCEVCGERLVEDTVPGWYREVRIPFTRFVLAVSRLETVRCCVACESEREQAKWEDYADAAYRDGVAEGYGEAMKEHGFRA